MNSLITILTIKRTTIPFLNCLLGKLAPAILSAGIAFSILSISSALKFTSMAFSESLSVDLLETPTKVMMSSPLIYLKEQFYYNFFKVSFLYYVTKMCILIYSG
ncbi:hypothetical protein D2A34_18975 [Clostridium chromiireducens]|uniref:Uncharacterized protein n=1 Tax=Clostridium chromiireducens TaxID=225345 RepID=A0A399IIU6_9CLOT|nr:hypothetical protein [Clostridium chromiireducens]RII32924.1 hypothetical protein D2A34_18975 [Clostridium chromiireducens]